MTPLKCRYCLAAYFAYVKVGVRLLSEKLLEIFENYWQKNYRIIVLFIVINCSVGL